MADKKDPPVNDPGEHDYRDDDGLSARVDNREAGQTTLTEKLDQVLGILGGKDKPAAATVPDDDGKGHPASVAAEIRAQLAERDRKAAADRDQAARDGVLQDLQAKVASLAETPPAAPPRRSTRLMWGNG